MNHLIILLLAAVSIIPKPAVVVELNGSCKASRAETPQVTISPALKSEAYILDIDRKGVRICAGGDAGVFYARQTLAQLGPGALPCVHIEDAPAFE